MSRAFNKRKWRSISEISPDTSGSIGLFICSLLLLVRQRFIARPQTLEPITDILRVGFGVRVLENYSHGLSECLHEHIATKQLRKINFSSFSPENPQNRKFHCGSGWQCARMFNELIPPARMALAALHSQYHCAFDALAGSAEHPKRFRFLNAE
jgi:hypothetical protein